ncbi:hypothetical protein HOO65_040101 [Ceratocystis lukuohia]|uniref:Chaperone-binding protein n=2 Tax=Ceratocystis TaxID=5157 RepID=A0A0F8BL82_CERFI|nr:hypothetical protein CFO_g4522 [Ceratocystis platani]
MALNIDENNVPRFKLMLHAFQIVCVFIAWICEIVVFKNAKITSNNGWVFGLCFMSIPAWIYLVMTPRFDKTRRFAEPHAMLTLDVIFTILWLSAFAAQAAYNSYGKCKGACGASKAIVGLGVLTFLSWIPCIILSMYTLQYYNNNSNYLPGYEQKRRFGDSSIDPDKAAFSMNAHDEDAYASLNDDDRDPGRSDEYASGAYGGNTTYDPSRLELYDEGDSHVSGLTNTHNGGGYGSYGGGGNGGRSPAPVFDSNTEYTGTMNSRYGASPVHDEGPHNLYADHSAISGMSGGGGHHDGSAPYGPDDISAARFPTGNYDRMA